MIETIKPEIVETLGVRALPNNPTASGTSGGYSATETKEAFDRLTVHVIEQYNRLIEAIHTFGAASIMAEIPTGIDDDHTVNDLIRDITNGNLASYLDIGGRSLAMELADLRTRITDLEAEI